MPPASPDRFDATDGAPVPVAVRAPDGRAVTLKWHKARLEPEDAPFRRDRLAAGLAAGAVVEVDLRPLADGGWVCLHDARLDDETTGAGPVAEAAPECLERLVLRGAGGEAPLRLNGLAALLRAVPPVAGHLQLDIKAPPDIGAASVAALGEGLARFGDRLVVSCGDWDLVGRLAGALPGARRGFDPIDRPEAQAPAGPEDWRALIAATRAIAAEADWIYLDWRLVLGARADGIDIVAPFREAGQKVDAWTLDADSDGLWRERLAALLAAGVDQVTTNTPRALAQGARA